MQSIFRVQRFGKGFCGQIYCTGIYGHGGVLGNWAEGHLDAARRGGVHWDLGLDTPLE